MSGVVASGVVRVRSLESGNEWDEKVEVFEQDLDDTDGTTLTVEGVSACADSQAATRETRGEGAARRQARRQAGFSGVETLEADLA